MIRPKVPNSRDFYWFREPQEAFRLGTTFAAMLYSIGLLYRDADLRRLFQQATADARRRLPPDDRVQRERAWHEWMDREIGEIKLHQAEGHMTAAEQLDEPILQCLRLMLERTRVEPAVARSAAEPNPPPRFD